MARGRVAHVGDTSVGVDVEPVYDYSDTLEDYSDNYSLSGDIGPPPPYCPYVDNSEHPKFLAVYYIQVTVFPVLLLQGIVGNALVIPTLVSLGRSAWSTLLYLALLGVVDFIVLFNRCGDKWYIAMTARSLSEKLMNSSDAVCRTYYFMFFFLLHLSPWLMVAAAVEMTIATRWARRTHEACTIERARYVIMLLTLIFVCLDINFFWTYGRPNKVVGCRYVEGFSDNFRDWIWPSLDEAVQFVLPLLVVSACFLTTALTLISRPARREEELRAHMRKYFLELEELIDLRRVVFVLSLVFLALMTFQTTYAAVRFLFAREFLVIKDCDTLNEFNLTMGLVFTLDGVFSFLFQGGKIYLYAGLSPAFRARLAKGFRGAWRQLSRLCRCSIGGHTWTLVARDDENGRGASAGKGEKAAKGGVSSPGESQYGYPCSEPHTTLPDGGQPDIGYAGAGNGTSSLVNTSNHTDAGLVPLQDDLYGCLDPYPPPSAQTLHGNSVKGAAFHDNPALLAPHGYCEDFFNTPFYPGGGAGDARQNGAVAAGRAGEQLVVNRAVPNYQSHAPRQPQPLPRGTRDTPTIALNTTPNSAGVAGSAQGENHRVSFGDHMV